MNGFDRSNGSKRDGCDRKRRTGYTLGLAMTSLAVCSVLAAGLVRRQIVLSTAVRNAADGAGVAASLNSAVALAERTLRSDEWAGVGSSVAIALPDSRVAEVRFEPAMDDGVPAPLTIEMQVRVGGSSLKHRYRLRPRSDDETTDVVDWPVASAPTRDAALVVSESRRNRPRVAACPPGVAIAGSSAAAAGLQFLASTSLPGDIADLLSGDLAGFRNLAGERRSPHPQTGRTQHVVSLHPQLADHFATLQVPTQTLAAISSANPQQIASYQIYDGGPTYVAQEISSILEAVTLRPSAVNPLGLYTNPTLISLRDDVDVVGTLICPTIRIVGQRVAIASPDGRDWIGNGDRLPAGPVLLSDSLLLKDTAEAEIDGAVECGRLTRQHVAARSATDGLPRAALVTTGRLQQPRTRLNFATPVPLSGITATDWAVRVESSGVRHRIVDVDPSGLWADVIGSWPDQTELLIELVPRIVNAVTFRGRVACDSFVCSDNPDWSRLTSADWLGLHADWTDESELLGLTGTPTRSLLDYLADPASYDSIAFPELATHGLQIEPTLQFAQPNAGPVAASWPLLRAAPAANGSRGGYQWVRID